MAEEVIVASLNHTRSWLVTDYLLSDGEPEKIAYGIAARHELRCERSHENSKDGYRFWWIE